MHAACSSPHFKVDILFSFAVTCEIVHILVRSVHFVSSIPSRQAIQTLHVGYPNFETKC